MAVHRSRSVPQPTAHGGHHDDHGPHESGKLITIPIVILAFFALTAGFANPTPLAGDALGFNLGEGVELFKKYVEPRARAGLRSSRDTAVGRATSFDAGRSPAAEGGEGERMPTRPAAVEPRHRTVPSASSRR